MYNRINYSVLKKLYLSIIYIRINIFTLKVLFCLIFNVCALSLRIALSSTASFACTKSEVVGYYPLVTA